MQPRCNGGSRERGLLYLVASSGPQLHPEGLRENVSCLSEVLCHPRKAGPLGDVPECVSGEGVLLKHKQKTSRAHPIPFPRPTSHDVEGSASLRPDGEQTSSPGRSATVPTAALTQSKESGSGQLPLPSSSQEPHVRKSTKSPFTSSAASFQPKPAITTSCFPEDREAPKCSVSRRSGFSLSQVPSAGWVSGAPGIPRPPLQGGVPLACVWAQRSCVLCSAFFHSRGSFRCSGACPLPWDCPLPEGPPVHLTFRSPTYSVSIPGDVWGVGLSLPSF